jgi:hypothetical protein
MSTVFGGGFATLVRRTDEAFLVIVAGLRN